MKNKTIKEPKKGIVTIKGNEYWFDGDIALPVKCKCGGQILKQTVESNIYEFDIKQKSYIQIDGNDEEIDFECNKCNKRSFYELEFDTETGKWE